MPYQPGSQAVERNLGPVGAAIIPSSFITSAVGTTILLILIIATEGSIPSEIGPVEFLLMLAAGGFGLALAVIGASFVVAFYLAIFGAPLAIVLGERIRHPLALLISLADAALAAVFAVTGSWLQGSDEMGFPMAGFAMVLCFALPAGYIYRRNVIAMRDEWSILNGY
ncbi:MAG: hypothetical protein CMN71_11085 [Sphingomonadaceae bacterium]|nr:hypothetical protein [Sphingomonadaceae bacterium]